MGNRFRTLQEQFDHSYTPEPMSGCWLWTKAVDHSGYSKLQPIGALQVTSGHRLSWQLHRGPIPPGMYVLHRCDVPSCVNPDHLFLGTHQDNMADMHAKGRAKNGVESRLTPDQRTAFLADTLVMTNRELSAKYVVNPRTCAIYRHKARALSLAGRTE